MYLGKKTLHLLYIIDAISVIGFVIFLVGPELLKETSVAEFMLKYRSLMIYHCIVFAFLTCMFQKLHAEIAIELKGLKNWISEIEKKVEK